MRWRRWCLYAMRRIQSWPARCTTDRPSTRQQLRCSKTVRTRLLVIVPPRAARGEGQEGGPIGLRCQLVLVGLVLGDGSLRALGEPGGDARPEGLHGLAAG